MPMLRATVLLLAFPIALSAQAAPAPTTNPVLTAFQGRITALHRNLAAAFDSIPAAMYNYKPTAVQQTVGYVAQHLASDSYFFCSNFGAIKPTIPADESSTADTVKANWPKETLVAKMKASFAYCASAFSQLDDAKLGEAITVTFNGNSRQSTRVSMVLGHALDLGDHYSQVANYMRLNKLVPPTALPRPRP
jgi:uncharacterized damage-inducible protein DinB